MVRKIDRDANRFKQIVRGKIKSDLRKYITHGEMIGKTGGEFVSIPLPQIEIPEFRYGTKNRGGVGQGPGDVGTPIGRSGDGEAGAGRRRGARPSHPRGRAHHGRARRRSSARSSPCPGSSPRAAPTSSRRRTSTPASARPAPRASATSSAPTRRPSSGRSPRTPTTPSDPLVIPIREDKLYRSWNPIALPQFNAVVFYLMDVSGSMTDDQKEIVRTEAFWIDAWLKSQYDGVTTRYIIHDAVAREVDEHTFYHTRESGGTRISSAYNLANKIIDEQHPQMDWNIYVFHFSDGDNWGEDNRQCISLLRDQLLPKCNLFCYGQVESPYGSGEFYRELEEAFEDEENLALSEIRNKEGIYDSIKEFLGRGR